MSNLSSYTVTLQNSANYRRVACLVYGCAFLLMANLSWPITMRVVVIAVLSLPLVHIIRNPKPQSTGLILRYSHPIWRLQENQNPEIAYESLRILIDTDLFFLLRLGDGSRQRLLVVFHDQLTEEDHHLFRVLEKIN